MAARLFRACPSHAYKLERLCIPQPVAAIRWGTGKALWGRSLLLGLGTEPPD